MIHSAQGAQARGLVPKVTRNGVLLAAVVTGALLACAAWIDMPLARLVADGDRRIIEVFAAFTHAGKGKWYLWPTGLAGLFAAAMAWRRNRDTAARLWSWFAGMNGFIFLAVAGSGIVVNIIKVLVGRARPPLALDSGAMIFEPFSFSARFHSFPSGHAQTVVAVAVAVGLLWPRTRWVLFPVAAVLAASRIVVSAHFLTDVVVGAALAVALTFWLRAWLAKRGWVFAGRADGSVGLSPAGRFFARVARRAWQKWSLTARV